MTFWRSLLCVDQARKRTVLTLYLHDPVYGLGLQANLPIPGLRISSAARRVDVQVRLAMMPAWLDDLLATAEPWHCSPWLDVDGEAALKTWKLGGGDYFRLLYRDGTSFVVNAGGTEVWADWPAELTLEDTATYLLGPIFGFLLRLRGVTCLHASAIAVDDQAIALIGPPGAGKSTTAAAFTQQGYSVLSEDVVALRDQGDSFLVQPGYPLVRLWPDSVRMLYGAEDALPPLTPNWNKCYLDLTRNNFSFQRQPLPLAALYLLDERSDDPAAPLVEATPSHTGLIDLVANTYTNYLLDQEMRAREFDLLGRLVQSAPLRKLKPHSDPARLPELCRFILDDFRSLDASAGDRR